MQARQFNTAAFLFKIKVRAGKTNHKIVFKNLRNVQRWCAA